MSQSTTKPTKWLVCPLKTQINLCIRPVWSLKNPWVHSYPLSAHRRLGRYPGWSKSSLSSHHFVGFVLLQLMSTSLKGCLWTQLSIKTEKLVHLSLKINFQLVWIGKISKIIRNLVEEQKLYFWLIYIKGWKSALKERIHMMKNLNLSNVVGIARKNEWMCPLTVLPPVQSVQCTATNDISPTNRTYIEVYL